MLNYVITLTKILSN